MTTAQDTSPIEVSVTEARPDFARLVRDAEYGRATYAITRHGKVAARLVSPDAGRMPDPVLWQAAQEAYDALNACRLSADSRRILSILGTLLAAYYGYDQGPAARTCVCGAVIRRAGTRWVDAEGWDHCDGTSTSHTPTQEAGS